MDDILDRFVAEAPVAVLVRASLAHLFADTTLGARFARVAGLRLRTLDGNFLAGTEHRLGGLRGCGAAARPGLSLVVRDGRSGLLTEVIPARTPTPTSARCPPGCCRWWRPTICGWPTATS